MTQAVEAVLHCIGCKKTPEDIKEYRVLAKMQKVTPTQYVLDNEAVGVWGPHSDDKFYCTDCYIKAGMPSRR